MVEKLSITLPAEMAEAIRLRVANGEYASTSEVLREATRDWLRREEERADRLEAIRARIRSSLADPRPSLSSADVRDRFDTLFAETADQSEP